VPSSNRMYTKESPNIEYPRTVRAPGTDIMVVASG
jgi:hypothetical protein